MVSVTTSDIKIVQRPKPGKVMSRVNLMGYRLWDCGMITPFEAVGSVTFGGQPGDSADGWSVGFRQVVFTTEHWGIYRGAESKDGSTFLQMSGPLVPRGACYDTDEAGLLFYPNTNWKTPVLTLKGGATIPMVQNLTRQDNQFPLTKQAFLVDYPGAQFGESVENKTTRTLNYLSEFVYGADLCSLLMVREPNGTMHVLRGVYWSFKSHYTARRDAKTGGMTILPDWHRTHGIIGDSFAGEPTDQRFASMIDKPQTNACNEISRQMAQAARMVESKTWQRFDTSK